MLAKFKFGSGPRIIINIVWVNQGVLLSSHLRYLDIAMNEFTNLQLAACWRQASYMEGHYTGPRALLHAFHHDMLQGKIILADFNLAVSILGQI